MATVNIENILFEMRSHTNYLTGYFTNGNGQISEAITKDDFTSERWKIFRLGQLLETLEEYLLDGKISISQIVVDSTKVINLLIMLHDAENKKGSQKDFPSVQN